MLERISYYIGVGETESSVVIVPIGNDFWNMHTGLPEFHMAPTVSAVLI